jgi:hypothetical protein
MKFLYDVDIVFNVPQEDKDPEYRPPSYDYSIIHTKR